SAVRTDVMNGRQLVAVEHRSADGQLVRVEVNESGQWIEYTLRMGIWVCSDGNRYQHLKVQRLYRRRGCRRVSAAWRRPAATTSVPPIGSTAAWWGKN